MDTVAAWPEQELDHAFEKSSRCGHAGRSCPIILSCLFPIGLQPPQDSEVVASGPGAGAGSQACKLKVDQ